MANKRLESLQKQRQQTNSERQNSWPAKISVLPRNPARPFSEYSVMRPFITPNETIRPGVSRQRAAFLWGNDFTKKVVSFFVHRLLGRFWFALFRSIDFTFGGGFLGSSFRGKEKKSCSIYLEVLFFICCLATKMFKFYPFVNLIKTLIFMNQNFVQMLLKVQKIVQ